MGKLKVSKIINDYINDDIIIDILKYAVVGSIVSIILTLCISILYFIIGELLLYYITREEVIFYIIIIIIELVLGIIFIVLFKKVNMLKKRACEKKSVNSGNLSFLWYTKKIWKELKYVTKKETSTQSSNDGG